MKYTHKPLKKNSVILGIISIILPVLMIISTFFLHDSFVLISKHFTKCLIFEKYGILCPGCGNTRFVLNLSSGHFLRALGCNITIPLMGGIILYYYYKWTLHFFNLYPRDIIRREVVFVAALIILIVYFIARNYIFWLAPTAWASN